MKIREKCVILHPKNRLRRMRNKIVLILLLMLSALCSVHADDTPNSRQARRIFNQAYQQVFGEQGATLHYDVNIIGIYKTNGTIWYKGKKSKFEDDKMNSWNDGTTVYTVKKNKKKKEVEIHSAQNNKSDKYSRKFKFEPENFDYSVAEDKDGLMLILKAKKGKKGYQGGSCLGGAKDLSPDQSAYQDLLHLDDRSRFQISILVASPTRCSVSPKNSSATISLWINDDIG